ncbi:MAG: hypothetical protein JNK65_00895 [Deltaproteobacteria bacterium]|nr:hypothetical protein [Deltaproteobacteria bacterium]
MQKIITSIFIFIVLLIGKTTYALECSSNFKSIINMTSELVFPPTNIGNASYLLEGKINLPAIQVLNIKSGALTLDNNTNFKIETNNCSGYTFVSSSQTCNFTVQFTPTGAPGNKVGSIKVKLTDNNNDSCEAETIIQGFAISPDTTPDTIAFTDPIYTVAENGVNAIVNVIRYGDVSASRDVSFQTSEGSAKNQKDYLQTSGQLSWQSGESGVKAISIPITNNITLDGTRTFYVKLSGAGIISSPNPAIVDILDDEDTGPGHLEFYPTQYSFSEDTPNPKLYIIRKGGFQHALQADLLSLDQTARRLQDYNFGLDGVSTIQFDENELGPKSVSFNIIDDSAIEGGEFFSVLFSDPKICENGFLNCIPYSNIGEPATVHLIDNDSPGILQFSFNEYTFDESQSKATVSIQRLGGNKGKVCADYMTTDETAVAGEDYESASGQICFDDGDSNPQNIEIKILNDTHVEKGEFFSILLSNPLGGATLGINAANLQIVDDDIAGEIGFSNNSYTFNENVGLAEIVVLRKNGSKGIVTVHYQTTNGTALAPDDFTSTSGSLTWADGDSTPKFIQIPIIWDKFPDPSDNGTETFSIILDSITGNDSLGTSVSNVNIIDVRHFENVSGSGCSMIEKPFKDHSWIGFLPLLVGMLWIRRFQHE